MDKEQPKIFISYYAHADIPMAERIYNDLKGYGLNIWFDKENFLPGKAWEIEVQNAIENDIYFLAVFSSRSASDIYFAQNELRLAFEMFDLSPKGEINLIPVRIDNCQTEYSKINKIDWIDLFPAKKYQNGLKKIVQIVTRKTFFLSNNPIELSENGVHDLIIKHDFFDTSKTFFLRNNPIELSESDVYDLIIKHDFFDTSINLLSKGFPHEYKEMEIYGDKVIFDEFSGLMWQQSGSTKLLSYEEAHYWIKELNRRGFAGFKDWRLSTLEESMSLMEPKANWLCLYINPMFDANQFCIWTADRVKGESRTWVVNYGGGSCYRSFSGYCLYVRAVHSE